MTANFTQETFYETLRCHGIELSDKQKQQFDVYAKMLVEWNEKMNLTASTQIDEIYEKHFLDSILPSFVFDISGSLCDVGAGAGFPSIPLKIVYPNLSVTIIETLGKRVTFLNELVKALALEDVQCLHARAEEACADFRESFDHVTARAVANLPMLSELCIRVLGCELRNSSDVNLSNGSLRVNVEFVKVKSTPKQYPRAFAKIKKNPLRGE